MKTSGEYPASAVAKRQLFDKQYIQKKPTSFQKMFEEIDWFTSPFHTELVERRLTVKCQMPNGLLDLSISEEFFLAYESGVFPR